MRTTREIAVRFFKLRLSQKNAIDHRLGIACDRKADESDFVYFRRVFIKAKDGGLLQALDAEIERLSQVE